MAFGQALREAGLKRGVTQQALGSEAYVSDSLIGDINEAIEAVSSADVINAPSCEERGYGILEVYMAEVGEEYGILEVYMAVVGEEYGTLEVYAAVVCEE